MAKKPYRKKNRLIKFYMDVPEEYENDEDFANELADTLDSTGWQMTVHDGPKIDVNKVIVGELSVEPED